MRDTAKFMQFKKAQEQLEKSVLRYRFADVNYDSNSGVYAYLKGMPFGDWIDLTGRSNTYNSGDLIENPIHAIESIIRDIVLTEKDLEVTTFSLTNNTITISGTTHALIQTVNDFYNDAYLINVTAGYVKKITDYVGSNKTLYFSSLVLGDNTQVGDKCYITNIKGNDLIDYSSFDSAGTSRILWKVAFSLSDQIEAYKMLDQLAFESQCMLYKNYTQYRIKPIGTGTTVGTLSSPLTERGTLLCDASLSNVDDIFTSFKINYNYLTQEGKFAKSIFCNKNDSSSSTYLGTTYKYLCKNAETNYRVSRELEIDLDFIHDETTAYLFAQRLIKEKTFQRLIVDYVGNIQDHIKYEKGDLVLINVPSRIPASKNNVTQFLITKQDIPYKRGNGEIIFKLVEMVA